MNWDNRDFWSLVINGTSLFVTLCTLGVTVYFTSQLVKNDNHRRDQAEADKWMKAFQSILLVGAGDGAGSLQRAAKALIEKHPDKKKLVYQAYNELSFEHGDKIPSIMKFLELLANHNILPPEDFKL